MKKKVLGLDLGTNSIGWALVDYVSNVLDENRYAPESIIGIGSRIIPMDAAAMSDFDNGNLQSQTSVRTGFRGVRRLNERHLLRRERLHRVLNILDFLPNHYRKQIDFEQRLGQYMPDTEPKIAYNKNEDTGRFDFYFKQSFDEMLHDFAIHQPDLVKDGKKVPYDWTIYYLRKKALTQQIAKEELAWLLLHFNQKRGYYQQRGEEEDIDQTKEYDELTVLNIEDSGDHKNGGIYYNVHLSDGGIYKKFSKIPLDWVGKTKEFIITSKVDAKTGNESRSYSIPSKENDWTLIKKRTEKKIDEEGKTVGCYIYDALLADPQQKIKGKLIQTIERDLYRKELVTILDTQKKFHAELQDSQLYNAALQELYRSNESYRDSIEGRDFTYLFVNNIIFYQRPLRSKKSQIDECQYEKRAYKNPKTEETEWQGVKCISKSHPLFEEFRLWQFVRNVKIMEKDLDKDVTDQFLKDEAAYVALFDELKNKKEIVQKSFLNLKLFKLKEDRYKWNYGDKTQPICPVRYDIIFRLNKLGINISTFLTENVLERLWHILYSVNDKNELETALKSFASKNNIDKDAFVSELKKIKPFDKDYGSYSAKAIHKLLPLMRMGKYWNEDAISPFVKERIDKIIDGEVDERISKKIKEKLLSLTEISHFKGLPLWLVCYIVYGAANTSRWTSPNDIDTFLREFKQYSLRNPIVEQVITETLRVVCDVWATYGDLSEIHIELGREMKNPASKRKELTDKNTQNETTNMRIKALLAELRNADSSIRPESPAHQQKMKLYEEGVLGSDIDIPEDIQKITRQRQPSKTEITRYKCWLEQGYCSPYTGRPIPLGQLFTNAYEVEHVIPQARYFDDSLSNKIICESAVNKEKRDMLAYEFISQRQNLKIDLGGGSKVALLSPDEYESFVKRHFKNSPVKRKKLMMDEIPDQFIDRQMNDTRYISKYVKNLMSNIVREEGEEEATSKNVIPITGAVTTKLKEDWGINDAWNKLVTPRFERLNDMTNSNLYGQWIDNKFRASVPDEYARGFSKKRIDHRHHAMDALVIACATRSHVNYLNNQSAKSEDRELRGKLRNKLCRKNSQGRWIFEKPYERFTQDAQMVLENTIISFKQNLRIINKSTNKYQRFEDGKKTIVKQIKGDNWAIRKPLHKDTVFGQVNLQMTKTVRLAIALDNWQQIVDKELRAKIKSLIAEKYDNKQLMAYFKQTDYNFGGKNSSKVDIYYYSNDVNGGELVATRKALDTAFDAKKIESITDSGIRQILHRHLATYNGNSEEAFSPDGIDKMNAEIVTLNGGKQHKPIGKVRVYETLGNKFNVGEYGNKQAKYVEAAKGTNLFFAVYQNVEGKRTYATIPLNVAIQNAKDGLDVAPPKNENGDTLLFVLSPNDLVYLPTAEQMERGKVEKNDVENNKGRIYKFVSCTENEGHFIPYCIASPIVQTTELGSNNKAQRAWSGEMIKETCVPIKIDRLGMII